MMTKVCLFQYGVHILNININVTYTVLIACFWILLRPNTNDILSMQYVTLTLTLCDSRPMNGNEYYVPFIFNVNYFVRSIVLFVFDQKKNHIRY